MIRAEEYLGRVEHVVERAARHVKAAAEAGVVVGTAGHQVLELAAGVGYAVVEKRTRSRGHVDVCAQHVEWAVEAHHGAAALRHRAAGVVKERSTAQGDDASRTPAHDLERAFFTRAETDLPFLGENPPHGHSGVVLNDLVKI